MADASWVYVMGTPSPSMAPVKIGYTSTSVRTRLEEIRRPGSVLVPPTVDLATIDVLFQAEADSWMERALHQHFRQYRVEGEWFTLDPAVAPREVRMAIAEINKVAERRTAAKPMRRSVVVRHDAPIPLVELPASYMPAQRKGEDALAHRDLFEQWTAVGFTEDQALRMVALMAVEQAKVCNAA